MIDILWVERLIILYNCDLEGKSKYFWYLFVKIEISFLRIVKYKFRRGKSLQINFSKKFVTVKINYNEKAVLNFFISIFGFPPSDQLNLS